jgi:hypothetical protein
MLSDDTTVPSLVVCVRPDNVLAVFPKAASDTRRREALLRPRPGPGKVTPMNSQIRPDATELPPTLSVDISWAVDVVLQNV